MFHSSPRPLAALALLGALAALPAAPGDETDNPHRKAPIDVPLVINERTRVISQGEAAVEAAAAAEPGRFSQVDGHWVDARGVFEWDEEEEIYWEWIEADVLTRGRQDFVQFCASCHGLDGDGYGRSAQGLRPPPRSFHQSTFKFTKVPGQYLPSDDALVKLIREGLDGTPMYPWAVSEQRLREIVQYIKSLSAEDEGWRDPTNEIGAPVEVGSDPWEGKLAQALEVGKAAYHKNQCYGCHPAYVGAAELNAIRGVDPATTYPADLSYSKLKTDSAFEVRGYKVAIPSPDFTWHVMRSGRSVADVYQTIAAGIGGAGMPTWKGAMPEADLWAIAHYVRHLAETYKDQPERMAFMDGLRQAK